MRTCAGVGVQGSFVCGCERARRRQKPSLNPPSLLLPVALTLCGAEATEASAHLHERAVDVLGAAVGQQAESVRARLHDGHVVAARAGGPAQHTRERAPPHGAAQRHDQRVQPLAVRRRQHLGREGERAVSREGQQRGREE